MLATEIVANQGFRSGNTQLRIQRPNAGPCGSMRLSDMQHAGWRMQRSDQQAEVLWRAWFSYTEHKCMHGDNCKSR